MYVIDEVAVVIDRFLAACPCTKYTLLDLKSGKVPVVSLLVSHILISVPQIQSSDEVLN